MKNNNEIADLSQRIKDLEKRVDDLTEYLKSALAYLSSDPQSSVTKCRIILEKLLNSIYAFEMGRKPSRGMIGKILSDKEFSRKLPPRIRARMNFVREIANLGPHGGRVELSDAIHVLNDVVYLTDWFVSHYNPEGEYRANAFDSVDILPQLKQQFADYLKPGIVSVKICQNKKRCFLEITRVENIAGYLQDEFISRTDLGFIANGTDKEDLFFDPSDSLAVNAEKFVNEFDEISIINCTDLFTEYAATEIYNYWNKHGRTPSGR